jgi:hypothetical protein
MRRLPVRAAVPEGMPRPLLCATHGLSKATKYAKSCHGCAGESFKTLRNDQYGNSDVQAPIVSYRHLQAPIVSLVFVHMRP